MAEAIAFDLESADGAAPAAGVLSPLLCGVKRGVGSCAVVGPMRPGARMPKGVGSMGAGVLRGAGVDVGASWAMFRMLRGEASDKSLALRLECAELTRASMLLKSASSSRMMCLHTSCCCEIS